MNDGNVKYKVIVYAFCFVLIGCATYRGLVGFEATDLSDLKLEMSCAKVEELLGEPIKEVEFGGGVIAHYAVDRGYVPPAEEDDAIKLAAPVALFVDVATLGAWGALIEHDENECQLGELIIIYGSSCKVLGARVFSIGTRSSAYQSNKRRDHCVYVMSHPRPETLEHALEQSYDEYIQSYNESEATDKIR